MESQQMQQILIQAQVFQQQLQSVLMQKENMKMQVKEIESALSELEKTNEKEAYKVSGPILIKEGIPGLKKDLKGRSEFIGMRLKTLEKEEKQLKAKVEELRDKLTKASTMAGGG